MANSEAITEIYVTYVSKERESDFKAWVERVHQMEATFPGFRKAFVQAPIGAEECWVTLLQFDTAEHLENWLQSEERQKLLEESKEFVKQQQAHHISASFDGWFDHGDIIPPKWKQTLLVLLVLFPLVMLEGRFVAPLMGNWDLSFKTFLGNALTVTLIACPFMPGAVYALQWWLKPQLSLRWEFLGLALILLLYAIEIWLLRLLD